MHSHRQANNLMAYDSKPLSSMLAILLLVSVASATTEGDIELTSEQQSVWESTANINSDPFGSQNAVVRSTRSLWRDNTIPYILDGSLSKHLINMLMN